MEAMFGATEAPPVSDSRRSRPRNIHSGPGHLPGTAHILRPDRGHVHREVESETRPCLRVCGGLVSVFAECKKCLTPRRDLLVGCSGEAVSVIRPEIPDWINEDPDWIRTGSTRSRTGFYLLGNITSPVQQLFARLEARRCLKDIEPQLFPEHGGPNHGEVVELYGPEGTGKTELLYHLLCRCVLPVATGGLEVDVVFVDTDYSLDLLRLVSILDYRLNAARSTGSSLDEFDESALRSCLSRLLVVHCSSSSQLVLTLHFLETSLSSRPGLALLVIDSISAFYWLDRCEGGASVAKQEEKLNKCAELLGRLLREYRITVFSTCHSIRRSSNGPSSSSDRPYLCRPWQRLVTHRLLCSRQEAANNMAATAGGSKVFTVSCTSSCTSSGCRTKASSFYLTDGGMKFI